MITVHSGPPAELGSLPAEAALSSGARATYDYWRSQARECLPSRAEMRVHDLAALLPSIVFVDPQPDPLDFRFRLMGSDIARRARTDRTGHLFSSNPEMAQGTKFWRRYEWVYRHGLPLFSQVAYAGDDTAVRYCEDLILPLATDGTRVDAIMTYVNFIGLKAP